MTGHCGAVPDATGSDGTDAVALVVVDMQHDYLQRPGLTPDAATLVAAVGSILQAFRQAGAPIAHVHTVVPPDGTGALPHWRTGQLQCVAGTPGVLPPPELVPVPGEFVAHKRHYSGFADPGFEPWLTSHGVGTVAVVGLMEHGCVRATAIDAVAAGFAAMVVTDATATDDPEHAGATRRWLSGRVAAATTLAEVTGLLSNSTTLRRRVSPATRAAQAVATVRSHQPNWAQLPAPQRAAIIDRWAAVIESRSGELAAAITADVHKPVVHAGDEVRRTAGHLRSAARLATTDTTFTVAEGVVVRRHPAGVAALVMPWNNPLAIPAAKASAALAVGNTVVIKPAPQTKAVTELLVATATQAGVPHEVLAVVEGGPDAAMAVVGAPGVDVVAVTGSIATGRRVAAECLRLGRPVQAELGGNNAVVVLDDADLATEVPALVAGAFAFSGQRCTAIRRAVVQPGILDRFVAATVAAMDSIVIGDPTDPSTQFGPLVSAAAAWRVNAAVDAAVASGATVVHRVRLDAPDGRGWCAPTLLVANDPTLPIVLNETFGPVLVVQPASDIDDAVALANGVEQGLVAAVCSADPDLRRRVADRLFAGIVHHGAAPPAIHPDAPFGGWGSSGIGPPEHGVWDLDLFTRTQAVYRS